MIRTFLLIGFLGSFSLLFGQEHWEQKLNKNGIEVFTKNTPNVDVKTFKAVTSISFPVELVLATILDMENSHRWINGIAAGELLEKESDSSFFFYQKILLPFPFSNRDVVQYVQIKSAENGQKTIVISEANHKFPQQNGFVRMQVSRGYWRLTPIGSTQTKIEYSFVADPGENVPAWLINTTIVENPYNTLKELNKYLSEH